jgi:hypothetical protein
MNMNQDQVKEVTKDALELPQIRFPLKETEESVTGAGKTAELAAEQVDIDKLSKYVENAFGEIAKASGLSATEVLRVIEDIHVEMSKDVLKDSLHADVLRQAIQEAIKKISHATALDTEQITHVFSEKKNTNLNDIVSRLHKRSQSSRAKSGNGECN